MSLNADDYAYSDYIEKGEIPELYTPVYMTYSSEVKDLNDMRNTTLDNVRHHYKIQELRVSPVNNSKLMLYYDILKEAYYKLSNYILVKTHYQHPIKNAIMEMIMGDIIIAQLEKLNIMSTDRTFPCYIDEIFYKICKLPFAEINNIDLKNFITDLTQYVHIEKYLSNIKIIESAFISTVYKLYREIPPTKRLDLYKKVPNITISENMQYQLLSSLIKDDSSSCLSLSKVKRQYVEVELYQKINDEFDTIELYKDRLMRNKPNTKIIVYDGLFKDVKRILDDELLKHLFQIVEFKSVY